MRSLPVIALLVAVPLAGCAGPLGAPDGLPDEDPVDAVISEDWPLRVLNNSKAHNHTLYEHHQNRTTPNFEEVGWNPQITDYHGRTSGGYHCGDTAATDDRTLAVSHSLRTDIAFVVTDVTDPENPRKIGELALPNVQTYDVALTPDTREVAVATSQSGSGEDDVALAVESDGVTPIWRDACTGTTTPLPSEVPYRSGVVLVDIAPAEPATPVVVDYRPLPALGAHSVFAGEAGGETFVLASTTNLAHQASYFSFYTVEETPTGPKLAPYGVWQSQYPTVDTGPAAINGHVDGWIQDHPDSGQTLGYLANWNGGMTIVELVDRGQIVPVARWNQYDLDPQDPPDLEFDNRMGQIHEAHPMPDLWNDTHYTFIGQEIGAPPEGRPTGQVIMLDTTDPADPEAVARWTLPADVQWGDIGTEFLMFSTHYVEVIDRTLFVSMYHGGVWAVDVEPPVPTELETLGAYLPADESPKPPGDLPARIAFTPTVLETRPLHDDEGTLAVWDAVGGIHTVRFDRTVDVPVPAPWTEDSWIDR